MTKFKVGDKVRVAHNGKRYENIQGFANCWAKPMNTLVGKVSIVEEIDQYGVLLKNTWRFPPQCLELVQEDNELQELLNRIDNLEAAAKVGEPKFTLHVKDSEEAPTFNIGNQRFEWDEEIEKWRRTTVEDNIPVINKDALPPWPYNKGDVYWHLNQYGVILDNTDVEYDHGIITNNEIFRTREEAEAHQQRNALWLKYKRMADKAWGDAGIVLDWSDFNQEKYVAAWDHREGQSEEECWSRFQNMNQAYFPTAESRDAAVEAMGDDFKKMFEG